MRTAIAVAVALALGVSGGHAKGSGGHPSGAHSATNSASGNLTTGQHVSAQLASGKRQHKPIKVIKEWGAASPMLRGTNRDNQKGGRYLAQ